MRREDRQVFGLWLALVWVLGFELLPAGHLALHDRLGDHHHGVADHGAGAHCHGDACHSHDPGVDAGDDTPAGPSLSAKGGRPHGAHTLAHRQLAAQVACVEVPRVLSAQARWAPAPRPLREAMPAGHRTDARARGPPMITHC